MHLPLRAPPNPSLHPTFASRLRRLAPAAELKRQRTPTERRASNGAEPGGGARGPHRDAPSRVGCGGKQAEDLSEPVNAGRASSAGPRRTLH
jgi:hypothetical protein